MTSKDFLQKIDHILIHIFRCADGELRWPRLRTLAVTTTTDEDSDASWHSMILESQRAGHPIRKLILPQAVILNAAGAIEKLRGITEMGTFHVDSPTPFN